MNEKQIVAFDAESLEVLRVTKSSGSAAAGSPAEGISPDGHKLMTHDAKNNQAELWDVVSGNRIDTMAHKTFIQSIVFSADSHQVATCSWDQTARVWDTTTGAALTPPLRHPTRVFWADFSPDNQHLLTVASDASVRIWDLKTYELVGATIQGREDIVARFRPSTGDVVTVDANGQFDVWDWRQSRRLCPPRQLEMKPAPASNGERSLSLSPDGRFALVGGTDCVYVIDLNELDERDDRSPEAILLEAEVLSHMHLLESSAPALLSNDDWLKRWKKWRESEAGRKR
jgi:WD40 repeat protein